MIFYHHPSTDSATLYYRTVPIMTEVDGRVAEVHVDVSGTVKQGESCFSDLTAPAGSSAIDSQTQDRRSRCCHAGGAGRCPEGGRPASGGKRLAAAGAGRIRHQKRIVANPTCLVFRVGTCGGGSSSGLLERQAFRPLVAHAQQRITLGRAIPAAPYRGSSRILRRRIAATRQ
jgi:hypothetical protein